MKKSIAIFATILLVAIFAFYMFSFQVRFTEIAVLKTFGEFDEDDIITEAGLRFKFPAPFQTVVVTDKRLRILEDTYEETQTKDQKNIMVTTYVCWRVSEANPHKFHIACSSTDDAESKLKNLVQSQKKSVVGQYNLSEFVNTDPEEFKFGEIEKDLRDKVASRALQDYGIEVTSIGIRRLSFPESISEQVFESMKERQKALAARYRTEGQADAQDIRARASAISDNIKAIADRLGRKIEAEANEEIGRYYAVFDEHPDLRLFLDRIEATKQVLRSRTTLILDSVIAPFGLLDEQTLAEAFLKDTKPQTPVAASNTPAPAGGASDENGVTTKGNTLD